LLISQKNFLKEDINLFFALDFNGCTDVLWACLRLGYEQYGGKRAFTFLRAFSEIFWFFFLFFCPKQDPKDFADPKKMRKPFGNALAPYCL